MELRNSNTLSTHYADNPEFGSLLDEGRQQAQALCVLMASINIHSGVAVITHADSSHTNLEKLSIRLPDDINQMLAMSAMSAPIAAEELALPPEFACYENTYIVVKAIKNVHGAIEYVALTFLKNKSLSTVQHSYLDIIRQKIEIALHYHLAKHPYSEKLSQQLALLEKVSEVSRVGAWELDRESGTLQCTAIVKEILGLEHVGSMSYQHILDILTYEERRTFITSLLRAIKRSDCFDFHFSLRDRNKGKRSIKLTVYCQLEKRDGVKLKRLYGAIQDETQTQLLSDSQNNFADYVSLILNHIDAVVMTVDEHGTVLTVNEQAKPTLGYCPDELIGQDINIIFAQSATSHFPATTFSNDVSTRHVRHKNGKRLSCEVSQKRCNIHQQSLTVVTIKDNSVHERDLTHYKQLAFEDSVTGLSNLCKLERYINEIGAKSSSVPSTRVFIRVAIKHISEYEDVFGVATFDYIMRIVSNRLARTFSSSAYMVAKGGRGAFYIVPMQSFIDSISSCEAISKVCNLLEEHVLIPFTLHNNALQIEAETVSCTISSKHVSYKKLIDCMAITAVSSGKAMNSGSLVHDVTHINTQDIERYSYIKRSLSRALSSNELFIELQPQYNAEKNIISSEVLLRWHHPHLGVIQPNEFIPIAEEDDAIADLGLWVCDRACQLLSECLEKNVTTQLSLNISTKHLARADFVSKFVATVERWKIPSNMLTLELAEGALKRGISIIQSRIKVLSEFGFNISIGNFGKAESNLNYLESLPIKELKVDRLFIEDIDDSDQKRLLVRSICNFANAMNINTVAEGIETDHQLSHARTCGCDSFQGFWLDKPMSVDVWRERIFNAQ